MPIAPPPFAIKLALLCWLRCLPAERVPTGIPLLRRAGSRLCCSATACDVRFSGVYVVDLVIFAPRPPKPSPTAFQPAFGAVPLPILFAVRFSCPCSLDSTPSSCARGAVVEICPHLLAAQPKPEQSDTMFARCDSPVWRADDFSECFEQEWVLLRSPSDPLLTHYQLSANTSSTNTRRRIITVPFNANIPSLATVQVLYRIPITGLMA